MDLPSIAPRQAFSVRDESQEGRPPRTAHQAAPNASPRPSASAVVDDGPRPATEITTERDEHARRLIIRIVESATGRVLAQFPTETQRQAS